MGDLELVRIEHPHARNRPGVRAGPPTALAAWSQVVGACCISVQMKSYPALAIAAIGARDRPARLHRCRRPACRPASAPDLRRVPDLAPRRRIEGGAVFPGARVEPARSTEPAATSRALLSTPAGAASGADRLRAAGTAHKLATAHRNVSPAGTLIARPPASSNEQRLVRLQGRLHHRRPAWKVDVLVQPLLGGKRSTRVARHKPRPLRRRAILGDPSS